VKGMFGDILAAVLGKHESFAVDAAGDVRFGGRGSLLRPIRVASPFDESVLHVFALVRGAVATRGIGKRSWLDGDGRPARKRPDVHQILLADHDNLHARRHEAVERQGRLRQNSRRGGVRRRARA